MQHFRAKGLDQVRAHLGQEQFDRVYAHGTTLSLEQVLDQPSQNIGYAPLPLKGTLSWLPPITAEARVYGAAGVRCLIAIRNQVHVLVCLRARAVVLIASRSARRGRAPWRLRAPV
jgi:hypothetical protein